MAKARQVGTALVATGEPRKCPTPLAATLREQELPPGVILEVARLVPAAHDALASDEFEARIAEYAARAERNFPLPLFGTPPPDVPEPVIDDRKEICCWACGAVTFRTGAQAALPFDRLTGSGQKKRLALMAKYNLDGRRWASRPFPQSSQNETYCPDCFEVWGWPDEYAREVERLERESEELNREERERLARAGGANGGKPAARGAG